MRTLAKIVCVAAGLGAFALIVSSAEARSITTTHFSGAYASVPSPQAPGSIPYDAGGNPFPTGHGGTAASPDFQLMR
jgi:hypothetical protein